MARLPRLYAPNVPQLVQARFAHALATPHDPTPGEILDRLRVWLTAEVRRHELAVHSWAITLDRCVMVATPAQATDIARVIQGLGRRMAAGMVHGRVFEGRYRSTLVDAAWLTPCLVWTETLPVALELVDVPARWPWSSAREHVGLRSEFDLLTEHPLYWELGNTPFARQARYGGILQSGLPPGDTERIERALSGQWALGDAEFVAALATRSSRRAAPAPRGRPRKSRDINAVTK